MSLSTFPCLCKYNITIIPLRFSFHCVWVLWGGHSRGDHGAPVGAKAASVPIISAPRGPPVKGLSLLSSRYYFLRLFLPFPRFLLRPKLLMEPKLGDTGYYKNLSLPWLSHFPTFHTLLIACVAVLPFSWKQYSSRDFPWPLSVVIIGERGSLIERNDQCVWFILNVVSDSRCF